MVTALPVRGVARVVLMWTPMTRQWVRGPSGIGRIGAGRNIGGGAGGEAPGSRQVLGYLTGIFTHLQGLKIIISLH